jgi:YidC/Oxa1 family membrane protein insertase
MRGHMNNRRQAETQNLIIAAILSWLVLMYWEYYIESPRQKAEALKMKAKAQVEQQTHEQELEKQGGVMVAKPRTELIAASPRVAIDSPSLHGSIALKGLRLDDLTLTHYRETLDPNSPAVTLFSPADAENGYFAEFGWASADKALKLPDTDTLWSADGGKLSPDHPLTLTWKNPDGITFTARIALDDKYLFTITQTALDGGGKLVPLQTYAYINRVYDLKKNPVLGVVHEGPIGVFDTTLKESAYKKLSDDKEETYEGSQGWLGMSDKYWLSAIIPPSQPFTAHFSYYNSRTRDHYQTDYLSSASTATTFYLFAGAKEFNQLEAYAAQYHIPLFDRAVDFGYFYWLAEPMFRLLAWFHSLVGNFGIAILLLTVVVKLCLYPLASKSFASMNQMKALQPRMAELRERHKGDKLQLNQAMIELYKREKVNPASGCLPLFIQFPVFISLYKVLYVNIEMRHAPFYGWIHDLSASDPTNIFTLFGLAPWSDPIFPEWIPFLHGGHLHVGIWPLLLCATMILQQRQSPPPPDPAQAKAMRLMPFFFLFLFSGIAGTEIKRRNRLRSLLIRTSASHASRCRRISRWHA